MGNFVQWWANNEEKYMTTIVVVLVIAAVAIYIAHKYGEKEGEEKSNEDEEIQPVEKKALKKTLNSQRKRK